MPAFSTICGIMRGFTTELGVGQCVINRTEPAKVLSNEDQVFTKHKVFQEANIKVLQRQKHRLHKVAPNLHPTHCSCSLKFLRPGPSRLGASLPPSRCGLANASANASASVSTTASPARQVLSVLPPGSSCSRGSLFPNRHHLS